MIDPVKSFKRLFYPIEDGYLYYPSNKGGGKLITPEEYDRLVRDWTYLSHGRGFWILMGVLFTSILVWSAIEVTVGLPEWAGTVIAIVLGVVIGIYLLWASLAPRRLVRGRPDHAPPRSRDANRRIAREAMPWRFVIFGLLFTSVLFGLSLTQAPEGLAQWAWTVGTGAFFLLYLWIAFKKWGDRSV